MGKIIKAETLPPLTDEEIKAEIEQAKRMPLSYDDDCPPLSIDQLRKGAKAFAEKKQNIM